VRVSVSVTFARSEALASATFAAPGTGSFCSVICPRQPAGNWTLIPMPRSDPL